MSYLRYIAGIFLWLSALQAEPLRILTSFSILADWVREIGGEFVVVESIVGPDTDPHIFTPTPQTVQQIRKADLVVFNGLGLEGWWPRLLTASQFSGPIVIVSENMPNKQTRGKCPCRNHDPHDPHIWHSVAHVREAIQVITRALIQKDALHKTVYEQNEKRYLKKLRCLDHWIHRKIKKIPEQKRLVITAHDAFSYFGHEYGIAFKAPHGLSTDSEPSSKDVAALIQLIKTHHVRAFFLENMTNPRIMQQLSAETQVQIVGVLYSDALSEPDGPASTYVRMIKHNVRLMVKAMMMNGGDQDPN